MTALKLTANLDPAYQRLHEAVGEKALIVPTVVSSRCEGPWGIGGSTHSW